ncbi:MAG: hypothetical protein WCJ39_01035 [bacterium]
METIGQEIERGIINKYDHSLSEINEQEVYISKFSDITAQFIKQNCEALFRKKIVCKSKIVFAVLVIQTDKGLRCFFGTNYINYPMETCPGTRNTQGIKTYENCKKLCKQDFHAETCAIYLCTKNNFSAYGGRTYITGHPFCCPNCEGTIERHGIIYAKSFDSAYEKHFGKQ